jgi:hypothetical protein
VPRDARIVVLRAHRVDDAAELRVRLVLHRTLRTTLHQIRRDGLEEFERVAEHPDQLLGVARADLIRVYYAASS